MQNLQAEENCIAACAIWQVSFRLFYCCKSDRQTGEDMSVNLIFKIAAVGIIVTVLSQILKHSGREEHAFLISLVGLMIVLFWVLPYIYDLFQTMQSLFAL